MKWQELLKFSFQSMWRRKLRSFLTILGVMIGTASIVVMMSIGIGQTDAFMKQIESSGTLTLIRVNSGGWDKNGESDLKLTADAVNSFAGIEHVVCASPIYSFGIFAKSGKYESYLQVNAMSYDMLEALKLPVLEGQLPERGAPFTIMAGKSVGFNFYDPNGGGDVMWVDPYSDPTAQPPVDVMEDTIFVFYDMEAYWKAMNGSGEMPKKYLMETSAVLGYDDPELGWSQYDYNCYADLEAVNAMFQKLFKRNAWPGQQLDANGKAVFPMQYYEAYVLVDDMNNVTDVQKQITEMGFQAYSDIETLKMLQEQSRSLQYMLGAIGSVSLIVAAIGIANTMMMSIFERTKEIGIYKVLGCSLPNIRAMFLSEAGMIGVTGGVFGIILSFLISMVINMLNGNSIIPFWLALVGFGFALGVGVIAGLSPALRAMKLSPLEAIRSL